MSYQTAFVPLLGNFLSGIEHPSDPIAPTFHDGVLISRWLDAALTASPTPKSVDSLCGYITCRECPQDDRPPGRTSNTAASASLYGAVCLACVRMVEVGDAERRALFGETDEIVARKTLAALRNGLAPVLYIVEGVLR